MNERISVVTLRASLHAIVDAHQQGVRACTTEVGLRAGVCAVVDDLRALGWPPERVIVAVKKIAAEAGVRPWLHCSSSAPPLSERDDLLARIIRWCIELYYRDAVH